MAEGKGMSTENAYFDIKVWSECIINFQLQEGG